MTGRGNRRIAVALILLGAVPLWAGSQRLLQLAGGPAVITADPRFDAFPVAIVLHIIASAVLALGGALQFVPRFRRRHRRWHRRCGRVVIVAGLLVVVSALWLTLFYEPQPGTGRILYVSRILVVAAMAACLAAGFRAIRRRDVRGHRAWMIRAYALGLGAGTQVFTEGIGEAIFGSGVLTGDLLKVAAWMINLGVAEWVIRRPAVRRSLRPAARVGAPS